MKQTLQKYGLMGAVAFGGMLATVGTVFATGEEASEGISIGTTTLAQGFASNLGPLITGVLGFVMAIAALLVFLYLIMGGIQWITSGGDKGKTEEARNKITSAVIGLIILAAAYAILQIMLNFLGLTNLSGAFEKIQVIPGATGDI